jgi:hypothetical protein
VPLELLFDTSSSCLWPLVKILCDLDVWLAFFGGEKSFLTTQKHKGVFEIFRGSKYMRMSAGM